LRDDHPRVAARAGADGGRIRVGQLEGRHHFCSLKCRQLPAMTLDGELARPHQGMLAR
jgi:hypothetical protein